MIIRHPARSPPTNTASIRKSQQATEQKKAEFFSKTFNAVQYCKKLSIDSAKNNQISHQCVMLSFNTIVYYRNF